jgi:molecular chaperone GrpE
MSTDPRFNPPGPQGPGAGTGGPDPDRGAVTGGPDPDPATEPANGTAAAAEEPLADDQPVIDGEADPDAGDAADVDPLQAKAAKADEYLALAQRTQADFENYRKRSARDAAAATQRGAMKLAKELLPAVDNLERALEHAPEASDDSEQAFVAGIKHVHSDLIAALQRAGIERYSPEGEPFDPTLHEAVAQQPFDGFAPGTVVEVFQRGYRIGESVVRPARVVVAG